MLRRAFVSVLVERARPLMALERVEVRVVPFERRPLLMMKS